MGGAITNGTGSNVTSLTKSGLGNWTLTGASTYTGPTTISSGTLAVTNGSLGNTAVSVASGATFSVVGVGATSAGNNLNASGGSTIILPGGDNTKTAVVNGPLTLATSGPNSASNYVNLNFTTGSLGVESIDAHTGTLTVNNGGGIPGGVVNISNFFNLQPGTNYNLITYANKAGSGLFS